MVTKLVNEGACTKIEGDGMLLSEAADRPAVDVLLGRGLLCKSGNKVRFSDEGSARLQNVTILGDSKRVLVAPPADLALEDQTSWELVENLRAKGFKLTVLPPRVRLADLKLELCNDDTEILAESKHIYFRKGWRMISPVYLQCLASLQKLRALGIKTLFHLMKEQYYKDLLLGKEDLEILDDTAMPEMRIVAGVARSAASGTRAGPASGAGGGSGPSSGDPALGDGGGAQGDDDDRDDIYDDLIDELWAELQNPLEMPAAGADRLAVAVADGADGALAGDEAANGELVPALLDGAGGAGEDIWRGIRVGWMWVGWMGWMISLWMGEWLPGLPGWVGGCRWGVGCVMGMGCCMRWFCQGWGWVLVGCWEMGAGARVGLGPMFVRG